MRLPVSVIEQLVDLLRLSKRHASQMFSCTRQAFNGLREVA